MKIAYVLSIFAFVGFLAKSNAASTEESKSRFDLKTVEVGGQSVIQGSGYYGGVLVKYAPRYTLTDRLSLGVTLELGNLKLDNENNYAEFGYVATARYVLSKSFDIQLSAGAQTWTCSDCGTDAVVGVTGYYNVDFAPVSYLKTIWLAYQPVFRSMTAHEIQVGAGFTF